MNPLYVVASNPLYALGLTIPPGWLLSSVISMLMVGSCAIVMMMSFSMRPNGERSRLAEFGMFGLMSKRLQLYETDEIQVTFDPNVCIHSGVCIRGLPLVFDVQRKRWIRPDLASAEDVAEQVRKCPSGALQYTMKGGE